MEVQIAISFAAGAIAAGFFGKLGEELYDTAKVWLKKLLLKKGMKHEGEENEQVEGRISIEYEDKENGFDVYYACRYSNDPELEIYLSSVPRLDAALRTACRSRLFPFDIGQSYSIYAEMQVTPRIKWDIRVHRYSENGEHLMRINGSARISEQSEEICYPGSKYGGSAKVPPRLPAILLHADGPKDRGLEKSNEP